MGACFNLAAVLPILLLGGGTVTLGGVRGEFWVAVLVSGLIGGPLAGHWFLRQIDVPIGVVRRVKLKLEEILRLLLTTPLELTYLATFFGLSAVLLGVIYAVFHLSFAALGIAAGPEQILLLFVLLDMVSYLNLTPDNIGVREIAFGVLGQQIGIGLGEAMLVSALVRAVGVTALFAVALPMGAVGELANRKPRRDNAAQSATDGEP